MTLHWHRMTVRERDAAVGLHCDIFLKTEEPDSYTYNGMPRMWLCPKRGLLRSEPYQRRGGGLWAHQWHRFEPTTNPADCALVKAKLVEIGHLWRINAQIKSFYVSEHGERFDAYGDTEEEAFCIYALRALGVTVETGECS